ncbi:MAG: Rieske 2Fe-2S domain-containing protein [Rhodoferax sp.]|nr:Rieske 2Fe-2S domain-containing protein [Rhodoferax sp.]MCF8211676.1 Rieske 2Fe-2S domain-containing protein [Rhodoferax sp.]
MAPAQRVYLCRSEQLINGAEAVPFDLMYFGRAARGFAIRFDDVAYAYLNQCTHIPMEMDYQPNQFFDSSGAWLICATHGATYDPQTGACRGGPCRGGLVKIRLTEQHGEVHWHTAPNLQPLKF